MSAVNWILGPQLIGAIFLLGGLVMTKYPPRKINNWYGYRTDSSKVNQETWDEANRFSSRYMIRMGWILIVVGLLLALLLDNVQVRADLKPHILPISMLVMGSLPAVFLIVATEKHLSKTFDKKTK